MIYRIEYYFNRILRGYVFIVPILIVYFLLLSILRKKQKCLHIATVFVFSFYLFALIAGTAIGDAEFSFSPQIMPVPFRDIFRAPRHFMLNIIAFIPFGVFLPLLYHKYCNIKTVTLTAFLFSLCIELTQMFGWGATEIDDLIANTFGACSGYYCYWLITKRSQKNWGKQLQAVNINGTVEVILLSVCTFLIMAFIEPMIHSGLFVSR